MIKSGTLLYVTSVLFRLALALVALPLLMFLITGENLGLCDWFIISVAPVCFITLFTYSKMKSETSKRDLRLANITLVSLCNIFIIYLLSREIKYYDSHEFPSGLEVFGLVLIIGIALLWSLIKERQSLVNVQN